ncbi:MAG: M28 family peptidase [Acidobacteria bacterium]|nr:M28 family peptidase [Acidobacteriota bacterium]
MRPGFLSRPPGSRRVLAVLLAFVTAATVIGQGPAGFDSARAWEHLTQLVAIGPRPAGSPQIRQTRAYLTRQLRAMGLVVQEQPFIATTPLGRVEMINLIVRLPGRRPDRVLFTGHYDTKLLRDQVFVGASDGGSSAAFLLELARVLASRPRELTYDLVWFDGEEAVIEWQGNDHTYGSRYYVEAEKRAGGLTSIRAMILVDMIGDRNLTIRRDGFSTPWLTDVIWAAAGRLGHGGVFVQEETRVEDDHLPFLGAGVPSVDIIDLDYPAWHTADDNLSNVSARSLQIVGDVLLAAIPEIERRLQ